MYVKKLSAILLILSILAMGFTPLASADSKYTTNLSEKSQDDLFNLKYDDVSDPLSWITDRQSYSLLEVDDTGRKIYWFNVPNPQNIIYNQATAALPTGYVGSGSIPSKNSGFYLIEIPDRNKAKTAMEKYGFSIPSPAYAGETPRITMSFMGVLIEDNPIRFVINKIKGFFDRTEDIIEAPSISNLYTLKYLTPSDYVPTKNTFERWIELYWDDTIRQMGDGQIIISGADEEGKKGGITFVKKTVLSDNGLNKIKESPKKLNNDLMELLGQDYKDVIMHIITIGIEQGTAKSFDQAPVRVMPYDTRTLTDADSINLVPDPRREKQTSISIMGLDIDLGLDSLVFNRINSAFLKIAGIASEFTVYANSTTNFTTFEKMGIDVVKFWSSPIMSITTATVMIILLFGLLGHTVKVAKGTGSIARIISETLLSFLVVGVLLLMITLPEKTYNNVKNISSAFMNIGALSTQLDDSVDILMGDGAIDQRVDVAYWVPYFSLWTLYNTSHSLTEKAQFIDPDSKAPEQKAMRTPKLASKDINLWSAYLADTFTEGPMIGKDAYRVVDHFMAPRIKIGEPPNLFTSTRNENFNKPIQEMFDIGIFLMIFIIMFAVIIKVVLFLEFMYYLMMFPINLALSTLNKKTVKLVPKEFMFSFLRVGLWDIVISISILISITTSGVVSFLMAIMIIFASIKLFIRFRRSNSMLLPVTLRKTIKYI